MGSIEGYFRGIFGSATGSALLAAGVVGWVYWMWMAIKLGSLVLLLVGILGPLGVAAAILGLWSLLFGMPLWLAQLA